MCMCGDVCANFCVLKYYKPLSCATSMSNPSSRSCRGSSSLGSFCRPPFRLVSTAAPATLCLVLISALLCVVRNTSCLENENVNNVLFFCRYFSSISQAMFSPTQGNIGLLVNVIYLNSNSNVLSTLYPESRTILSSSSNDTINQIHSSESNPYHWHVRNLWRRFRAINLTYGASIQKSILVQPEVLPMYKAKTRKSELCRVSKWLVERK